MSRAPGKTAMDVYRSDLARVSALARALTDEGPGRFGTAETLRYLLNAREEMVATIEQLMGTGPAEDLAEQIRDDTRHMNARERTS
jgi:hypothetical protein